jgi:hypothetical protein
MVNEFKISNQDEIYKADFDSMVTLKGLEIHTLEAVTVFYNQFGDILQKGEENELSSEDKNVMELIKAEVNSLTQHVVVNDKFEKAVVFTRPIQIDIEKGIYLNTHLNRKLGRVGKEWGGKKKENSKDKPAKNDSQKRNEIESKGYKITANMGYENDEQTIVSYTSTKGNDKIKSDSISELHEKIIGED